MTSLGPGLAHWLAPSRPSAPGTASLFLTSEPLRLFFPPPEAPFATSSFGSLLQEAFPDAPDQVESPMICSPSSQDISFLAGTAPP